MRNTLIQLEDEILEKIIYLADSPKSINNIIKIRKLQKIMVEYGLKNSIIDKSGNIISKIEGKDKNKATVLISRLQDNKVDSNYKLTLKNIIGENIYTLGVIPYTLPLIARILDKNLLKHNLYIIGLNDSDYLGCDFDEFLNKADEEIESVINLQDATLGLANNFSTGTVNLIIKFNEAQDIYSMNIMPDAIASIIKRIQDEDFKENVKINISKIVYEEKSVNFGEIYINIFSMDSDEVKNCIEMISNIVEGVKKSKNISLEIEELNNIEGALKNKSEITKQYIRIASTYSVKTYAENRYSENYYSLKRDIDSLDIGIAEIKNIKNGIESVNIDSFYIGIEVLLKTLEKIIYIN